MRKRLSSLEFSDIVKITIALAVAVVVILLAIFLKDTVREGFLIPIYYLIWWLRHTLESLPQIVLWELLVLLGVVIAIRSLYRGEGNEQPGDKQQEVAPPAWKLGSNSTGILRTTSRTSRYQIWSRATKKLDFNPLSPGTYDLRRLVLEVLAYQTNLTPEEAEAMVLNGTADLPEEISAFILTRQLFTEKQNFSFIDWLKELLQPIGDAIKKLSRHSRRAGVVQPTAEKLELEPPPIELLNRPRSRKEQQLETIIHYLEQQLEVHHDT